VSVHVTGYFLDFFYAPLSLCSRARFFLASVLCSVRSFSSFHFSLRARSCKRQLMYIFASAREEVRSIEYMCDWRIEFSARCSLLDVRLSFFHSESGFARRAPALFDIGEAAGSAATFAICRAAAAVNLWTSALYASRLPERIGADKNDSIAAGCIPCAASALPAAHGLQPAQRLGRLRLLAQRPHDRKLSWRWIQRVLFAALEGGRCAPRAAGRGHRPRHPLLFERGLKPVPLLF
jgi:hypothetical protein